MFELTDKADKLSSDFLEWAEGKLAECHDGEPTVSKPRSGRPPDPKVAARNKQVEHMFRGGASVDEVCREHRIAAALARKIKSKAGLTRKKRTKKAEK